MTANKRGQGWVGVHFQNRNPGPSFLEMSWKEPWSGLPFPSPGDLPEPGIEPGSPAVQADTLTSEPPGKPPAREGDPKRGHQL